MTFLVLLLSTCRMTVNCSCTVSVAAYHEEQFVAYLSVGLPYFGD